RRDVATRKEPPSPRLHGDRLRALGEQALATHRALVPPPSDGVYEREARELQDDLALFLKFEAEDCEQRRRLASEGVCGAAREGKPRARGEPVTIDLGDGLRFQLRGRIDRNDRLADRRYEHVGYKTGGGFLSRGLGATV